MATQQRVARKTFLAAMATVVVVHKDGRVAAIGSAITRLGTCGADTPVLTRHGARPVQTLA